MSCPNPGGCDRPTQCTAAGYCLGSAFDIVAVLVNLARRYEAKRKGAGDELRKLAQEYAPMTIASITRHIAEVGESRDLIARMLAEKIAADLYDKTGVSAEVKIGFPGEDQRVVRIKWKGCRPALIQDLYSGEGFITSEFRLAEFIDKAVAAVNGVKR